MSPPFNITLSFRQKYPVVYPSMGVSTNFRISKDGHKALNYVNDKVILSI